MSPKSKPPTPKKQNPYSVHPGLAMVQKWIAELPEKTGKTLEQWTQLLQRSGPPTDKERIEWLKTKHSLGTNSAGWIVDRAAGRRQEHADPAAYLEASLAYVEAMFAGPKGALRPTYDCLLELGFSLGKDVKACPCKTIVPLYRNHVFAQIKPSTRTRIDFGLALGNIKPTGRLIDTGGFAKKDRITHRIPIAGPDEIDEEVRRWLKIAYDLDV